MLTTFLYVVLCCVFQSNYIDAHELEAFFEQRNIAVTEAEIKQMIADADEIGRELVDGYHSKSLLRVCICLLPTPSQIHLSRVECAFAVMKCTTCARRVGILCTLLPTRANLWTK